MIVYYTGTGNSRYVAQRFAAALGDDLITANECIRNDTPADLHSDRPWVFVSPTYGWQIPHIFADFLRRGRFTGSRKAYFVMTCGSEIGNAGSRIAALCADIGLDYQGVLQVVMPENYVAMCNRVGREDGMDFAGESLIVHPSGDVIYKADDREQLIVQELDLAEARLWREQKRPYLRQRRPECYL